MVDGARVLKVLLGLWLSLALFWRAGQTTAARAVMRSKTGELCVMLACRWASLEPSACLMLIIDKEAPIQVF